MSQRNTRTNITEVGTCYMGDCFSLACPRAAEVCLTELGCEAMGGPSLEACRQVAIEGIRAAFPLAGDGCREAARSLELASSREDLRTRLQLVSADLIASHTARFVDEVLGACARAAAPVGFTVVECSGSIAGGRVIAMREDGCALVTELTVTGPDHNVTLSSEVVGAPGAPGECALILERHDAALEHEGVRCDQIERRPTGGRPRLEAARAAARELVQQQAKAPTKDRPRRAVANLNRSRTRS